MPTCQMYALALLNTHSVAEQCNNTHLVKWSDIPSNGLTFQSLPYHSPFAFHYFVSLFRPFLLKGLHLGLPTCQMYALALLNTPFCGQAMQQHTSCQMV